MKKLLFSLLFLGPSALFADGNLDQSRWYKVLNDVQNKAIEMGISNHTINKVIQPAVFEPSIIQKDKNQAEFKLTLKDYVTRAVNKGRIENGKATKKKYATLLARTFEEFEVPPHVILAFWGMESNYGTFKAQYKLSDAFLTLIYDGRREKFFSEQLFALMKHADKSKLEIDEIRGSWAGAMGHFQFIPTTLQQYGKDGDNDKKIDIINNIHDAMFSAGNYLSKLGWNKDERIVRKVGLPSGFDVSLCDAKTKKDLSDWEELGVTGVPGVDIEAGMVCDSESPTYGYLTYPNFYRIKRWNNSNVYAVAIATLADELK